MRLQMLNPHRVPTFTDDHRSVHVIVETPRGSSVKYAWEPKSGFIQVRKLLPPGMIFPFNFGMVPGTLASDGDPLDVVILNEEPLLCPCLVRALPVGIIQAEQSDGKQTFRNDRIIAHALPTEASLGPEEFALTNKLVAQIEFFFKAYNTAYGKRFTVLAVGDQAAVMEAVTAAVRNAKQRSKDPPRKLANAMT